MLSLLTAPSAQAATSLGETSGSGACGGSGYSEIQVSTAGPPSYTVPADGRITSWNTAGNSDTDDVFKLRIYRPTTTPDHFLVAGESAPQGPLTPNAVNGPFSTSIAVKAGDLLGLTIVAGTGPSCIFNVPATTGDTVMEVLPDSSSVGDTVTTTSTFNVRRVNVAATWEPPSPTCVVPKLKGKSVKKAKKKLRGGDCRLGTVKGRKGSKVKKQNPKPGTVLPAGSAVNVKLG